MPGVGEIDGQFFFNDAAPLWEDWSYFGSANWHKGDGTPWPVYGEIERSQPWRDGSFPANLPDAVTVGPLDQIAGDSAIDPPSRPGILGLPLLCWSYDLSIIVRDVSLTPTVTAVTTVEVNELDGLAVTEPTSHVANIALRSASASQKGAMDTAAQSFQGIKTFTTSIIVGRGVNDYQISLDRGSGVIGLAVQSYVSGSYNHNLIWAKSFNVADGYVRVGIGYSPDLNTGAGFVLELSSEYNSGAMAYYAVSDGDGNIYSGTTGTISGLQVHGGLITGGTVIVSSVAWSAITGTPTTLAGYGIGSVAWSAITGTPTTLAGYAITDAQPLDADLTALAALTGTNTIYYRSAADTWTAVTIGANLAFAGGTLSASFTLPDFDSLTSAAVADGDQLPFSDVSAVANRKIAASALRQYMVPPGTVMNYAGSSVPSGWLNCDGSAVSRSTYADLFTAIGTTWGAGNGSTTFNVPDLRGRAAVGVGTGSGLSARNLGSTGGTETHTLSTGEIPSHSHAPGLGTRFLVRNDGASAYAIAIAGLNIDTENCSATANTGGGGSHNNMQPFANLYHIIKT